MNWKLVLQLSLFGLVMAFATVFVVPADIEPVLWLAIFLICAFIIAKRAPGKVFLHGLMLGIVNSVWITLVHFGLFSTYLAHHAQEAEMMKSMPMPLPPRVMLAIIGPCIGAISGVVIGLLALLAALIMRRGTRAPAGS